MNQLASSRAEDEYLANKIRNAGLQIKHLLDLGGLWFIDQARTARSEGTLKLASETCRAQAAQLLQLSFMI